MAQALPGQLIGARYRLVRVLNSGGFGRVWLARDEELGVDVAVKEVWLPPAMSPAEHAERLVRAKRESRHAAALRDHPNVVAVHDLLVEDDAPWIVMQLVDGQSLAERLAAQGPLPLELVEHIARGVLSALSAAHAAGILHRDVKPANVMLTADGQVLLADFGIAVHQTDTTITATGGFVGSLEYLPPERFDGGAAAASGDLYSLGVTLYQAVEGFSPFHRDSTTGTLAAVIRGDAPVPQRAGRLTPLITALMSSDPARRPSVEQAIAMLDGQTALRHTVLRYREPNRTGPSKVGRRYLLLGVGAALGFLVLACGVGYAVLSNADIWEEDPIAAATSQPASAPASVPQSQLPVSLPSPSPEEPACLSDDEALTLARGANSNSLPPNTTIAGSILCEDGWAFATLRSPGHDSPGVFYRFTGGRWKAIMLGTDGFCELSETPDAPAAIRAEMGCN